MALGSSRSPQFFAITSRDGGVPLDIKVLIRKVNYFDRGYFETHPEIISFQRYAHAWEFAPLVLPLLYPVRVKVVRWGSSQTVRIFSKEDAFASFGPQDRMRVWQAVEELGGELQVSELERDVFSLIRRHFDGAGDYVALSEGAALLLPTEGKRLYDPSAHGSLVAEGGR